MANSPEASLKEAVSKLTMCEEDLMPFLKDGIHYELLYEKIVKARDLVTDALNWDEPER